QRDRGFGTTQSWRAISIEPLQHFHILDQRQYFTDWLLETDVALFDQLHGCRACDGLGHRRNAKHRVERHWFRLVDRTPSERAFVNNAAIVGRDRDQTRNETRFYWLP